MTNTAPALTDSKGVEILPGDTGEVVIWDTTRGTTSTMLHHQVRVTAIGRSRVTVEMANPAPNRYGTVTRSVGPETLLIWAYMRSEG